MFSISPNTSTQPSTSLYKASLASSAKSTFRALDTIYQRSNTTSKKIAVVTTLLEKGFDINQKIDIDGNEMCLLDVAIEQSDYEFVQALIKYGATQNSCREVNKNSWLLPNKEKSSDAVFRQSDIEIGSASGHHDSATASWVANGSGTSFSSTIRSAMNRTNAQPSSVFHEEQKKSTFGQMLAWRGFSPVQSDENRANDTVATQQNNLASTENSRLPCCVGASLAGGVISGGFSSAVSALSGYTGAAILQHYYQSYDPMEATRMGAIGGAILGSTVGLIVGPYAAGLLTSDAGNSNQNKHSNAIRDVAMCVAMGLVGYGVMNQGSSETTMNLGQTAASFALGSVTLGVGIGGAFCIAVPICLALGGSSSTSAQRRQPVDSYTV